LKLPGTKRLKQHCDILLSTSAFKLSLRRYSTDTPLFPDLRLDEDPRLASGCFVAWHILSLVYSVKFRALSQQVLHIPGEVGLDEPDDARHVIDRVFG
jgi:hypothetical protein